MKPHNVDKAPWAAFDEDLAESDVGSASAAEASDIDAAVGLQMISIRLERRLIADLKAIAEHHGVGYQPLIRDLLNRFAKSELRDILHVRMTQLEQEISRQEKSMAPIEDFLSRERKL